MAEVTVAQLAEVVGIPVQTLLQQMNDAGLPHGSPEQPVSDTEKQQLLAFLKKSHGERAAEPQKITLKRKSVSQLRVSNSQGKSKTVSVGVRKKRTYMKRSLVEGEAEVGEEDIAEETQLDTVHEETVPSVVEPPRDQVERAPEPEVVTAAREPAKREIPARAIPPTAARKKEAARRGLPPQGRGGIGPSYSGGCQAHRRATGVPPRRF